MDTNWKKIEHYIRKIQWRLALNSLLDGLLKGMAAGSGAALLISVAALIFPWYAYPWFMLGALALGLISGIVWGLINIPRMKEAALTGDSAGLNEALITALERRKQNDAFSFMQREVTAQRLEHFDPRRAVKLCFPWKTGLFFTILAALCVGQFFIPTPARSRALAKQEAVNALAEKKALIEEVKDEVAADAGLLPEKKEQLTHILDQALEELAQAESVMDKAYEDAVQRLDMKLAKAAEGSDEDGVKESVMSMSMKMDLPSATEANACARELTEGLKRMKDKNGNNLGEKMSEDTLGALASDMARKQAAGQLSQEALEQMALAADVDASSLKNLMDDTMGQLAAQNMDIKKLSGSGDGTPAASCDNTLSGGDDGQPSGFAGNNSGGTGNGSGPSGNGSDVNDGGSAGNGSNGDGAGGDGSVSGMASSSGSGSSGNSGSGGSTDGSGSSGSGAGTGGSGGSGSGNGSGTGSGGNGSGSGAGSGWNYGSRQGFEKEASDSGIGEVLNLPNYKLGDDDNLQGTKSNGNKTVQMTNSALTYAGQSVGYDQVIGDYSADAYQQIEQAQIPDGMKDLVKNYFSALNQ